MRKTYAFVEQVFMRFFVNDIRKATIIHSIESLTYQIRKCFNGGLHAEFACVANTVVL